MRKFTAQSREKAQLQEEQKPKMSPLAMAMMSLGIPPDKD